MERATIFFYGKLIYDSIKTKQEKLNIVGWEFMVNLFSGNILFWFGFELPNCMYRKCFIFIEVEEGRIRQL